MTLLQSVKSFFRPFDGDDWHAFGNIACCVLGMGSLGMGRSYSAAGPVYTSIGLMLMAIINIYATSVLTKAMNRCPPSVKTFGDIGHHIAGNWGRYVVVIVQFGSCIFSPIAFLVLGGSVILPKIFEPLLHIRDPNLYIPLMAVCVLPIVLIRSLKEGAWVAVIGFLGAFIGDFFAVFDSWAHATHFANTPILIETTNVLGVFGTLSLGYGAAVVVPAVQREHSHPEDLPRVIALSLGGITIIYFIIGGMAYAQYGCASPSNLLLSVTMRELEVVGLIAFFIHIVIGFVVLLNPALFLFERFLFGFHEEEDDTPVDVEAGNPSYIKALTPGAQGSLVKTLEVPIFSVKDRLKSYVLRVVVVSFQVLVAMLLQGCFEPLSDFIGSTCITFSCIVIPVYMYWHLFRRELSNLETAWCWFIIITCSCLGIYSATNSVETMIREVGSVRLFYSRKEITQGIQPLVDRNGTCALPIHEWQQIANPIY